MKRKQHFLFSLLMLLSLGAFGQTEPKYISIKTPESYAFGKNIETPVSYYSGRPAISIPIYEIQVGNQIIPISVSYNAGGIRINERATIVGLGWNLELGGQISRKRRGGADERGFYTSNSIVNYKNLPNHVKDKYLTDRASHVWQAKYNLNNVDYMPDEFYFSALGYAGRYMFSQKANKYILFPKDDIDVVRNTDGWELRLPNGNRAIFTGNGAVSENITGMTEPGSNSWNINHLVTPNNDSVTFNYESFSYFLTEIGREVRMVGVGSSYDLSYSENRFSDKRIESIKFPLGKVTFSYIARDDLPTKALDKIRVTNNKGELIKEVNFHYSYFQCANHYTTTNVSFATYAVKRLKLDSVSVKSSIATDLPQKYRFTYYEETNMPSRFAYSSDYWGYHNGINNPSLVPNIEPDLFVGGNKKVVPERAKVFSLKTMQFPEGITREFLYEGHTALSNNVPGEMLLTYQDDNFVEKSEQIYFSGYDRTYFVPAPDSISSLYEKIWKKTFEVPRNAFPYLGKGLEITTDFGQSQLDQMLTCQACRADFALYRINGGQRTLIESFSAVDCINNTRAGSYSKAVEIYPGKYQMEVKILYRTSSTDHINQRHSTNFVVKWRELDFIEQYVNVGGLRIKEIKDYDKSVLIRHKKYTYENGRVVSFPIHRKLLVDIKNTLSGYGSGYYSNSLIPLETTVGAYTGYEYVTEELVGIGANQTLKTKYKFSYKNPLFSEYYGNRSLAMLEPKEWERGNLLRREVYRGNDIIYTEDNEYYFYSPHLGGNNYEETVEEINTDFISFANLAGFNAHLAPIDFRDPVGLNYTGFYYGLDDYTVQGLGYPGTEVGYPVRLPYFERYTGFGKLKSRTVTRYDGGTSSSTTINYYDNTSKHYQPTRIAVTKSDGSTEVTANVYPEDYANGTTFIDNMKRTGKHLLAYPIEQVRYKEAGTARTILSGAVTKYLTGGKGLVDQVLELETSQPIALSSFKFSNRAAGQLPTGSIGATTFSPHSGYKSKLIYSNYDAYGNARQVQPAGGPPVTYIWSYKGQYPVAEIKNGGFATVQSALGGDQAVKTFTDSYPSDTDLRAKFNGIRSLLPNSALSYYTYDPLNGMTSATDPSGRTTYYNYDGFGRLKETKDTQSKTTGTYEYHYR